MFRILRRRLIKLLSKIYDPLMDLQVGNQHIRIFMSHQLRENVRIYPEYNYNLPRIIKYTSAQYPAATVIDIGANVGDTVAFIRNYSDAPVLCIDGEEKYIKILKSNVAKYANVSVCQALVGSENKAINAEMKVERGTAFVETSGKTTQVRTLENILQEFPAFQNSKILKTDTDGFDTIILRACANFLKTVNPVLFFEFDPYLISKNNDNPSEFITYLHGCGYQYFIFYMNNGDYLLSCDMEQRDIIEQLIQFFSGRNIAMFADVCAFHKNDKGLFELCKTEEMEHFKKARAF